MDREAVKTKVIEIISGQSIVEKDKITEETSLDDLKLDDLDKVEIIMYLEEEIGLEIPDEDVDKHFEGHNVKSVIDYITDRVKDREGE